MNVFISYAIEDEDLVKEIEEIFESLGVQYFRDRKNIEWGGEFQDEINVGLLKCSIFLVVISPASLKSSWVHFETGQATAMGKTILSFLIHPAIDIPDYLKKYQYETDIEKIKKYFQEQRKNYLELKASKKPEEKDEEKFRSSPIPEYVKDLRRSKLISLKVPNSNNLFSSFEPWKNNNKFLRIRVLTTQGWIKNKKIDNYIYIVRDPIRPFEIQIGEIRANRPGKDPGIISLAGDMSLDKFKQMYPVIINNENTWMRLVLSEIVQNPDVLTYIYDNDPDERIKNVVSKNPFAPDYIKQEACLFCNKEFIKPRLIYENTGANLIANDFPYGPFFHYIAMPKDPVHSWEDITEENLRSMNLLTRSFFLETTEGERSLSGSVGIRVGLNSSIRHLVMGKTTRSSAGASIAHVHKQIWGMTMSSQNLADHLCKVCDIYDSLGIDYLEYYLKTLDETDLIIWQDEHLSLYIPFGQTSVHELQIMMKRKGAYNYLDLFEEELYSLSKAEFFVTNIFKALKINSFNEIMLSRTFNSDIGTNFRLIITFITREVDIAVSELSLIYVVDKHPFETYAEIKKIWPTILKDYELNRKENQQKHADG